VIDATESPGQQGEAEAEWQTITRQAVNVASKSAGSVPAHLERLIERLTKPRLDWREILRQFTDPASSYDYTWQRPDRRFGGASFLLPGTIKEGVNCVVLGIDVSGSIADADLQMFASEAQAILDEGAVENLVAVYCNTHITKVERYTNGDKLSLKAVGGGGTDFAPVFEWARKNEPDATAIVYLTDLEGPCRVPPPDCPVLWVATGREQRVPFGDVIPLGD
jgi:predicted metal-dependent peptidase